MKDIINKLSSASIVLMISWIIAYGTGFAQTSCCMAAIDRCQTNSKEIGGKTRCGLPCIPSLLSTTVRIDGYPATELSIVSNQKHENAVCCDTDSCFDTEQTVYIQHSNPEAPRLAGIEAGYEVTPIGPHPLLAVQKEAAVFQSVPIFIQKNAFLC